MKIQLIRHATLLLYINDKKILVDPMLSAKGIMTPIPKVINQSYNPLVDLPFEIEKIIDADAILLTHIHRDHFDDTAIKLLSKEIPVFCQPEDAEKILSYGFLDVKAVDSSIVWNNITFNRTGGRHGDCIMSKKMGVVSGYILSADNEPSLYIMGDTVWCSHVKKALDSYKPQIAVAFAGAASFHLGGNITMNCEDIYKVIKSSPETKVIATHLEAWNHCCLSRNELKSFIKNKGVENLLIVPEDGEMMSF